MNGFWVLVLLCTITLVTGQVPEDIDLSTSLDSRCNFDRARDELILSDNEFMATNTDLKSEEHKLDAVLRVAKAKDVKQFGWLTTDFMKNKATIEKTRVFKALQEMPKVVNWRVQFEGMHDLTKLIPQILADGTHGPKLMVQDNTNFLSFYDSPPSGWQTAKSVVASKFGGDAAKFGQSYIFTADEVAKGTTVVIMKGIRTKIKQVSGFLNYQPVTTIAMNDTINNYVKVDKLNWFNMRKMLGKLYKLEGGKQVTYNFADEGEWWQELWATVRDWKNKDAAFSSFFGFGLIPVISGITKDNIQQLVADYTLMARRVGAVVGFDAEGDERDNENLMYDSNALWLLRTIKANYIDNFSIYVHAGLTHWPADMSPNDNENTPESNMFDVLQLLPKRIGHGYAFFRYPALLKLLLTKNIPIEVAPIYEQSLKFGNDIRDQPATTYMRSGVVIAISSEAPAFFGYTSLAYDWYYAVMSWGADIAWIKNNLLSAVYSLDVTPTQQLAIYKEFVGGVRGWSYFTKKALAVAADNCMTCRPRRPGQTPADPSKPCRTWGIPIPVGLPPTFDWKKVIADSICLRASGTVRWSTPVPISGCVGMVARWNGDDNIETACRVDDEYHIECDVPFRQNGTMKVELNAFNRRAGFWKTTANETFNVWSPPQKKKLNDLVWDCDTKSVIQCLMEASLGGFHDDTQCEKNSDLAQCAFNAQCLDLAKQFCFQQGAKCPSSGVCMMLKRLSPCDTASYEQCRASVYSNPRATYCGKKSNMITCATRAVCQDMVSVITAAPSPPNSGC